jgi:hypothetical protein
MARPFRMGDKPLCLFRRRWANYRQRNRHVLEVGRRIVHIVFFGIAEGRAHIGGSVINGHIV